MSGLMRKILPAALVMVCAAGASGKDFGPFGAWFAESHKEGDAVVCSMWSTPGKQEGEFSKRGDVFVFVTHRPASGRVGEVFVETGYEYRKGSEVQVAIGGYRFVLLTSGSTAWALSETDEPKLVSAMRAGAEMLVTGTSWRGTETRDTYSLSGFSAAHKAISTACRVK